MLNEDLENSVIDKNLEEANEELGFVVEDWDEDEVTTPFEIPNTVYDKKSPVSFYDSTALDMGLSIMSGIVDYGVKPICDAVTALGYTATNLALEHNIEFPTKEEVEKNSIIPEKNIHFEPQTTAGKILKPLSGAIYTGIATSGALGAANITGKSGIITNMTLKGITKSKEGIAVGKILAPLVNGMVTDGLAFWEDENNLSGLLAPYTKNPTIKSILDYMSIKEDDTFAERFMKQALEGAFISTVADGITGIFKGLKKGYKYIAGKKEIKEAAKQADNYLSQTLNVPKKGEKLSPVVINKEKLGVPQTAIQQGQEKGLIKQTVDEINQTRKELGFSLEEIGVPRHRTPIDEQAARNKVAMALSDFVDLDDPESMKVFSDFVNSTNNPVESVLATLKAEHDGFVGGWVGLKAAKKNADNAGVVLSNTEKTEAFADFLKKSARGRGIALDDLYKDAKPMNIASKDIVHKANKKLFLEIENNADEIATPELFDLFESAKTEEELISKLNSFFSISQEAMTKKGFDTKKLIALEQAGLMNSPDTLIRNGWTSIENLTLGVLDDVSESLFNAISKDAVKYGGNARQLADIYAKGGAYANYLKDSALWGIKKVQRALDKTTPQAISPWAKYRQSLPNKFTTNLPTELGHTFSNEGSLGRIANGYIKYSGVGFSEATDSFFDAGFFRGEVAARANAQARRLKKLYNLNNEQTKSIAKTMTDNISNIDTARRAYDIAEINEAIMAGIEKSVSRKASLDAAVMTFRGGQGAFTKGITAAVNKIPGLKIFTPFVKTSSTIVFDRFIYDRTPYGLLYEGGKSILSYLSPNIKSQLTNPSLRNKFLAKQAVGASLLTLGAYLYSSGNITGDYSSDPDIRRQQMASGWQPNSFVYKKDDGTLKFVSLNNLGVMSMLLKYPAKIVGYYHDWMSKSAKQQAINETETAFLSNCFGMSLMLGSAVAEETVLRNISNAFDRLNRGFKDEKDMENFFINIATSPAKNIIPRVFRQALGNHDYEEIIQNNFDSMVKTFDGLPIKHDDFGDPIERADFLAGFAGVSMKELSPNERYKGIMAKFKMSTPGINTEEFPTKSHSVRLDDYQKDKVRVKMKQLGIGEAIKDIVMDMPKEMTQKEVDFYQELINKRYNQIKRFALQELVLEDSEIGENYNKRIDFDLEEKYNIDKPAETIPSLSNY